ncbi:MAG: hypothetical protein KC731_29145 [Myxococcales bacterium]|nr:hypothetical protein [Myxococcales bacterium]
MQRRLARGEWSPRRGGDLAKRLRSSPLLRLLLLTGFLGCQSAPVAHPAALEAPEAAAGSAPRAPSAAESGIVTSDGDGMAEGKARPLVGGERVDLPLERSTIELPEGRWVVRVALPRMRYVTLGLLGPPEALRIFDVLAPSPIARLRAEVDGDDHRLPAFVALRTREQALDLLVVVDATEPVTLLRVAEDPLAFDAPTRETIRSGRFLPRPLVAMPFPIESGAGYFLQGPSRYHFVRADVARALRQAFHQVRRRLKGRSIAVGDISQWNGRRPALDMGKARHISHDGGRDVDIGLPATSGASEITRRCEGVLVDEGVLKCGPGTVRDLDGTRLAYLLSLLIDGPTPGGRYIADPDHRPGPVATVETIFTDQAYIDEIRRALPSLRAKRWIHDEAYAALGEDGLLRPSPWHVDHVHIRFTGERAQVGRELTADPTPEETADEPAEGPQ